MVGMAMDSVCGRICAWELGWGEGVWVREKRRCANIKGKMDSNVFAGPYCVAVVGTILSVTDSYMIV